MESLTKPSYPSTALRLSAGYDVIVAFLHVLLQIVEDDEDIVETSNEPIMSPDLLLKLRGDLSETFSLTMEYLRDRWDSSRFGALGLHPDARAPQQSTSNTPLPLTWDNPSLSLSKDPITLAGLRAISIWLREDDNPTLHKQALGIMDIMLTLYTESNDSSEVDFRPPVLTALSALLQSSDTAVQDFLQGDGWSILSSDLLSTPSDTTALKIPGERIQDIVRVLLAVVESDYVQSSKEAWMTVITTAVQCFRHNPAVLATPPDSISTKTAHDILAIYQITTALVLKAPKKLQSKLNDDLQFVVSHSSQIAAWADGFDQEIEESAGEIIGPLELL
jgi:hypothetical protein